MFKDSGIVVFSVMGTGRTGMLVFPTMIARTAIAPQRGCPDRPGVEFALPRAWSRIRTSALLDRNGHPDHRSCSPAPSSAPSARQLQTHDRNALISSSSLISSESLTTPLALLAPVFTDSVTATAIMAPLCNDPFGYRPVAR